MTLDWDAKIRMDCSSPYAMASLVDTMSGNAAYDIATGNDADADRHGIVTPDAGLMNPNHYLAVAIHYLFSGARPQWGTNVAIGKTLVSSALIDRVAHGLQRQLLEVPVGFKWFVPGLINGTVGFGGEESAGASFLRADGTVWTTDKDGILLALLASEITAVTGKSPSQHHTDLTNELGSSWYARIDAPATREQNPPWPSSHPTKSPPQPSPVTPSQNASPPRPATTPPSEDSKSPPTTPGSRHAPPAPKTSTKSMLNHSSPPTTSPPCKLKRKTSSATH